jgi:hypothetical protein
MAFCTASKHKSAASPLSSKCPIIQIHVLMNCLLPPPPISHAVMPIIGTTTAIHYSFTQPNTYISTCTFLYNSHQFPHPIFCLISTLSPISFPNRDRHLKLMLFSRGHWPFDGGRLPSSISSTLLFNLTADPSERHDLALKMPEEVGRLKTKLVQLTRGKRRMPNAIQMHTDPRGWPQKHGGTFAGGWC